LVVLAEVLRRFEAGGVDGGASLAEAFFLPRGMSSAVVVVVLLQVQHSFDFREPIL
jgi:hypothetical protein